MKEVIKKSLRGLLVIPALALALGVAAPLTAEAQFNRGMGEGAGAAQGTDQAESLFGGDETGADGIFQTITNVLLFIIGAIAVIMLVIGGVRYTTSGGNSEQVTAAKNTIMYAIIGIIVAILAFAIVNFVISSLVGGATE